MFERPTQVPEELEKVVDRVKELTAGLELGWDRPLPTRIYLDVAREQVRQAAGALYEDLGARFVTATGTDEGDELEALYHFSCDAVGLVVNLRVKTPKSEAVLPSLTPVVPPAEWIEREMYDLLGIAFEGHPRPERLILSDDWPKGVHPLRKDKKDDA